MDTNWDLHKENVQPLPQGRKVSELGRFLTVTPNSNEIKKREETRKEFEDQLRCDCEDKLAVWNDYINWVEQNYPEGGEEANLMKLIENCMSDLFNSTKYHQDERFFRIFLRYTRIVADALELYNVMFNQNIFTSIAPFYVNWATLVEKNFTKAEEIIRIGLEKMAQPIIQLELALKEVQLIAAEHKDESEEEEDIRKPFVPLKVEKKKSGRTIAPVERLNNYEQSNFKLSAEHFQAPTKNSKISIFIDENGIEAIGGQQEIVKKLPTNNQENQSKAGRWCDNKIKSKSRLDQAKVEKFEIQEDQDAGNEAELKSRQANKLKEVKKDDKEKSPRLVIFEKLAPNQRFYCDLKKIYCGGTEYSFEEIRSIRLKLAKRKEDRLSKEMLLKEVEDLKKQISTKDNLVNDVEMMKKKLESLMKQNNKFNVDRSGKPIDPIEHCTREKQVKLDHNLLNELNDAVSKLDNFNTLINRPTTNCAEPKVNNQFTKEHISHDDDGQMDVGNNMQQQQRTSPKMKDLKKEDLTIVRNLWNGSIEDEQTVDFEHEMINKPRSNDFSIFKDDDHEFNSKNKLANDLNNIQSTNFQIENPNTFALPHGDFDFVAKHASTPASHYQYDSNQLDENCTINVYQGREHNKFLSPIVETSKEYKSSSSSSLLSGFSYNNKSRSTFHK